MAILGQPEHGRGGSLKDTTFSYLPPTLSCCSGIPEQTLEEASLGSRTDRWQTLLDCAHPLWYSPASSALCGPPSSTPFCQDGRFMKICLTSPNQRILFVLPIICARRLQVILDFPNAQIFNLSLASVICISSFTFYFVLLDRQLTMLW